MNLKALWTGLPLLLIGLAALVLWHDSDDMPAATVTLACDDLARGCATRLHGREVSIGLSGPVKALKPLDVWVKAAGAKTVQARFTMQGMDMGFNLYTLSADGDGIFRASVTLPICVSGRRDWIMAVQIDADLVTIPFSTDL